MRALKNRGAQFGAQFAFRLVGRLLSPVIDYYCFQTAVHPNRSARSKSYRRYWNSFTSSTRRFSPRSHRGYWRSSSKCSSSRYSYNINRYSSIWRKVSSSGDSRRFRRRLRFRPALTVAGTRRRRRSRRRSAAIGPSDERTALDRENWDRRPRSCQLS